MKNILGISAFYHDSAACILANGEIIAAAQEERFTRIKNDARFPIKAINYVLAEAGISLDKVDYIVFYEKPFLKFERLLETYVANAPRGFGSFRKAMPIWLREKLFQKNLIVKELKTNFGNFDRKKILFSDHHLSHAASAFYPSPFESAIVLTLDGVGEWSTTTVWKGKKNNLKILKEIQFPHSIGLLYSAFTYYIGFKVNSGEYKLMGLAPYGIPKYKKIILDNLIDLKEDGSFRLNQRYFNYSTGLTMINNNFENLFGEKTRKIESHSFSQFHMDIAASIQAVTEEIILKITRFLAKEYKNENLCLAGGVALNCVVNGKVLKDNSFKKIWIQPAAGDSGGALGAALSVWYNELKNNRTVIKTLDSMKGAYLGPEYSNKYIKHELTSMGAIYSEFSEKEIILKAANFLKKGKVIGWFQGRMEFGPRSLGNRSILADSRFENAQKLVNLKIKFRESFRPFAPAILREDMSKWFDLDIDSPYMLLVLNLNKNKIYELKDIDKSKNGLEKLDIKRSEIQAVTHVDYSARIQTVHKESNDKFHKLINKFKELTGCPVLINTSFNIRGEPIVCSPNDAFKCLMGTKLDALFINNFFIDKQEQDSNLLIDYRNSIELD